MSLKRKHGSYRRRCTVCRRTSKEGEGSRCAECLVKNPTNLDAIVVPPGGLSREYIAAALSISTERVRQIEKNALEKLKALAVALGWES